jgi:hypothetical protein
MDLGAKFLKSAELLHGSWSKVPEFLKKMHADLNLICFDHT